MIGFETIPSFLRPLETQRWLTGDLSKTLISIIHDAIDQGLEVLADVLAVVSS